MQNDLTEDQNNLKQHRERITPDLDSCGIKENNYYEDISSKALLLKQIDEYREQYIVQTVIIYFTERNGFSEKFVSQTFSLDTITLETYVLNNEIILYVDTFDTSKYFVDFNPNQ